jgi:hypothetical protein
MANDNSAEEKASRFVYSDVRPGDETDSFERERSKANDSLEFDLD